MVFCSQVRLHYVGDGVWSAVAAEGKGRIEYVSDATMMRGIDGFFVDLGFVSAFLFG